MITDSDAALKKVQKELNNMLNDLTNQLKKQAENEIKKQAESIIEDLPVEDTVKDIFKGFGF